jgi:hypothetical protein
MDPDLDLLLQLSDIVLKQFHTAREIHEEEEWAKSIEGLHDGGYYDRQYQTLAANALRDYNKLRVLLIKLLSNQIKRYEET